MLASTVQTHENIVLETELIRAARIISSKKKKTPVKEEMGSTFL